MNNIKTVNAQQPKLYTLLQNNKQKVNKTNTSIWCNQICRTYPHTTKTTKNFI